MASSRSPSAGARSGTGASRRTFLQLAGATAGIGLATGGAVGEAGSTAETTSIAVSPAHRTAVEESLGRLDGPTSETLSVETIRTRAAFREFAAGEVGLLVGSRPILASEHARTLDNDRPYDFREVPSAMATLRPPAASWSECLQPSTLAATWASEDAVETWAEISSADATSISGDGVRGAGRADDVGTNDADVDSTLIRGVRSHQYATGAGGVGYYEPDRAWIGDDATTAEDESTTLVRLSFLYGGRAVLDRPAVGAFLDAYDRQRAERVGTVAYFADPLGQ